MSSILVAYFSASGVTAQVAQTLAQATGAGLWEIRPAAPYTRADLNWMDKHSRSSVEMGDPASRPALADPHPPVGGCDTIFLGFPIWWYTAPTILKTFLESADFSGKTIVLFATSGGSPLGKSARDLAPSCPGAVIREGGLLNGSPSAEALKQWAARFL